MLRQKDIALVASLVGRKIEKALWYDASPSPKTEWTSHETGLMYHKR